MTFNPPIEGCPYAPPEAMRLGGQGSALGLCDSGSGDYDCVTTGHSATLSCEDPGNAAQGCLGTGQTASALCDSSGSNVLP
jgi:hypothetical protein